MAKNIDVNKEDDGLFNAVLYPHRSLGTKGFTIFMSFLFCLSLGLGLYFTSMGAWPVLGFFGLEVLVIYTFFRLNYKAAQVYETVELTPGQLIVREHHLKSDDDVREWRFNPAWVKLQVDEKGTMTNAGSLKILSHGKGVAIGSFLSPEERLSFRDSLEEALHKYRFH